MSIFENIRDKVLSLFENSGWVKWVHDEDKPAYTQQDRELNIVYGIISKHCAVCLNLNDCCFPKNNMPVHPHHLKCHCKLEPVTDINFKAVCRESKFTVNIFNPPIKNGKNKVFNDLGYDIMDSQWLTEEYCRQAQQKYASGDFELNKLSDFGQQININITIPYKDGTGSGTVITGWMVCPNGTIELITAFSGWAK